MAAPHPDAAPPFATIAVFGVGLIGGSVGLAARARWRDAVVIGVDRREVLREAISLGAVSEAGDLSAVARADLVVLAAPIATNLDLMTQIAPLIQPTTLVTDVGSTKRAIVAAARTYPSMAFVGGHPLSGTAVPGVRAARAQLFRGRPWILTPEADASGAQVQQLTHFVQGLGGVPEILDAERHDRLVAFVSHLPQLVASSLLHTIGRAVGATGLALSGPGLADTTRLASSPADVWTGIFESNADNVELAVDELLALLGDVKTRLREREAVTTVFESAARWRAALRHMGERRTQPPSGTTTPGPVQSTDAGTA